ncbi:MAG: PH domain-containing protein [Bryobacteraceae bacterium]|jgi:uncharacterized membrane protein YdbT with pleckstrin-like domain|nr:PH domain-containing protein [Bryobacteraceae bacterium]
MTQPQTSQPLVIRPTIKRAVFGFILSLVFLAFVLFMWLKIVPEWPWYVVIIGAMPMLAPLVAWIDSRRVRLELENGSARHVSGLFSQTTRNLVLRNVSDVRVERSLAQRLWNIGTLVIEMPGESGRVVLQDIDRPQEAADALVRAARAEGASPRHG